MNLLTTILRAAHCRSTHHFFAIDALSLMNSPQGQNLRSVLLKHYARYLEGAKDPDTKFRDFRNHVMHVNDGYWGGATKKAQQWYDNLIDDLDSQNWSEAAYSAGVLSHYYSDPLMPLHTAQSDAESVVHRPMEWSVTKSYQRILERWQDGTHRIVFEIPSQSGWLVHAIRKGAEVSNRYYDDLIQRYDLKAGVKRPTEGLDEHSIDALAGLFGLAITGWARILERAAGDTQSDIPSMPLTAASLVATIQMPSAWITRRIESKQERAAVQAIFDEYQATGKVQRNKPAEVKSVAAERQRDRERAARAQQKRPTPPPVVSAVKREPPANKPAQPQAVTPTPVQVVSRPARKPRLAVTDDIVDAPSIGPKTAKRFEAIGITTVEQFLNQSPQQMETALKTSWITAQKLADWQCQARLVCAIPSLCGYKSQLLVGVGANTVELVATQSPAELQARIAEFATTSAGRSILRSSKVPGINDVAEWISDAGAVTPTRKSA